jgi:cytochrome c5
VKVDRAARRIALAALLSLAVVPLAGMADEAAPQAGEKIVGNVCSVCHGSGLLGAPKIGDTSAWQARFSNAGSVRTLVETAEHGKGNMPPRGGVSRLSQSDIESAIQFMLGKSGVSF